MFCLFVRSSPFTGSTPKFKALFPDSCFIPTQSLVQIGSVVSCTDDDLPVVPPSLPSHLYVQCGEVTVQLLWVVDVGLAADGTHHVSDVFVSHGDGEVLPETLVANRALAGSQGLHLRRKDDFNLTFIF